jgi:hypothetical protein
MEQVMSNKPENKAVPEKKDTRIDKADQLVEGSEAELGEEDLKRVSGGAAIKYVKGQS